MGFKVAMVKAPTQYKMTALVPCCSFPFAIEVAATKAATKAPLVEDQHVKLGQSS